MAANAFSQALRAGALDELYAKADTVREKMLKKGLVAEHSYHFKVRPSASSLSLWLCCFREFSLGDCAAVWKTLGCAA